MNKQEIIDKLRLELRDRDMEIIMLTAKLKEAEYHIKRLEQSP